MWGGDAGGGCWGPAWQSRQSEPPSVRPDKAVKGGGEKEKREKKKKTLSCNPHTQSLTFIINYGCFCFISPQPLTTELLAVKGGEDGGQGEEKKGQFSSKKELSIKTREMEPRLRQGPVEAMRTDGDLFGFNRKRASGKR